MSTPPSPSPETNAHTATQPLGAALSLGAVMVAVLSIPLDAANQLSLSPTETTGWILALYGVPSVISLVMSRLYRQPLLVTGNVFILIFVLLLGAELPWAELVGATMLAGLLVLILGVTGLTHRLADLIPAPIVFGILAGAVLPLVASLFTQMGRATVLVGTTFLAYLAARAVAEARLPAILPAMAVGLAAAVLTDAWGPVPSPAWPVPSVTAPELSLRAVLTATPVMVVLITLQANVPSIVFLRSQGYEPPERSVSIMSGAGTVVASIFGPLGVSLSLPGTALVAGPDAGEARIRHRAAYGAAALGVGIALLAGFASELTAVIPAALLTAVVGLAVIGVLSEAIQRIGQGPLLLGPLLAFAISLSELQLFGLGRFFWALAIGLASSFLLEREQWRSLRPH